MSTKPPLVHPGEDADTEEPRRDSSSAPPCSGAEPPTRDLFRSALFLWLRDQRARSALETLSAMLDQCLAHLPPLETDPTEARVKSIVAELSFLTQFLTFGVDAREERYIPPEHWELAQAAGQAGASLASCLEDLCAITGQPVPELDVNAWEKTLAVRETALWHATGTQEARAVRRIGQMALINAREVKASEPDDAPESSARRAAQAAVTDMLHLATFASATALELEAETPPRRVLEALELRLAELAESLCAVGAGHEVRAS